MFAEIKFRNFKHNSSEQENPAIVYNNRMEKDTLCPKKHIKHVYLS